MKKVLITLLVFVAIIALVGIAAYFWYQQQISTPASDSAQLVEVEIEQGDGIKTIAVKLQTVGVVKSSDVFYFYVKLNNLAEKMQAGKFRLPQNLTVIQVANYLQKAGGNDLWITIPEGLRTDEIATLLDEYFLKEDNTVFDKDKFLEIVQKPDNFDLDVDILQYKKAGNSLEGFLFPDTYNVEKDITSEELVKLFVGTLDQKIKNADIDITANSDLQAYDVIILASIIEREARTSEQRYMVSDILQKRLRGEMDGVKLLQADATLLYEEKDWETVVTKELKEKDTPYNTYKYTGLPPTPICNPGIDSIKAVLNPMENEYFFYLHDDEGKIHYAKTSEEHTNNQRCFINKNQDYCL